MSLRPRLLKEREGQALLLLAAFTAFALFGFWNFALHPERLPTSGWAIDFYTVSFQFFGRLHVSLAAGVLGVALVRRLGWRWWPALVAVYGISLAAEYVGIGYGVPFGGYEYTGLLGFKIGGRVPALIPLSWFFMALPAWVIARAFAGGDAPRRARVALGALWLLVWDLALDPAMSYLTPYWRWQDSGPYFGMPWINLAGWYATGLVLMTALEVLRTRTGIDNLPRGWMSTYYALILAFPLGMLIAGRLWTAVIVTILGVGFAYLVSVVVHRLSHDSPTRTAVEPSPVGVR